MKEEVIVDGQLYAIIVYASFQKSGIEFFTPSEFSQQLAAMSYGSGKVIEAHVHNSVHREVFQTQEALFIRKGKIRVDFYTPSLEYRKSRLLGSGDVILLVAGGHGFEVIEDLDMVEIKQGPYAGDKDKTRFTPDAGRTINFD